MKKQLTFSDALRKSRPTAFGALVKPVGSACNLRCNYCYYLDKEFQYEAAPKVMSMELLEEFTQQYIAANRVPEIDFLWHGGEPLMAGLDFYRAAIEFQRKYASPKVKINNVLQTNGTLLDDEWCRFFADNNFLIGLSIDGPEAIHNATRRTADDRGSWNRVMAGLEKLHRHGVEFNTLSAVSRASEGHGVEIYNFLKSIGSRYMQFLPVVEYVQDVETSGRPLIVAPDSPNAQIAPWSLTARGYGQFMVDIFEQWVVQDVGIYYVQLFDATLAGWMGVQPGVCSMCEVCGDGLVVEHNGDVYSCDHFVYPEYRLGNISRDHLKTMFSSGKQFAFGLNKRNTLPATCERCIWLNLCHGECPKHRKAGEINALCEGFARFFRYSKPYMEYMVAALESGRPAATVTSWAKERMGVTF